LPLLSLVDFEDLTDDPSHELSEGLLLLNELEGGALGNSEFAILSSK
jgi:hypothetical protein